MPLLFVFLCFLFYHKIFILDTPLFVGKVVVDTNGNEQVIDSKMAQSISYDLAVNGYIDKDGALTDQYYAEKVSGTIMFDTKYADCAQRIIDILDSVFMIKVPRVLQRQKSKQSGTVFPIRDRLGIFSSSNQFSTKHPPLFCPSHHPKSDTFHPKHLSDSQYKNSP